MVNNAVAMLEHVTSFRAEMRVGFKEADLKVVRLERTMNSRLEQLGRSMNSQFSVVSDQLAELKAMIKALSK